MEPNWALSKKRVPLENRARIVHAIRAFFIEQDFLEVETPHRLPGNAPELHINAVASGDWFLHTSPELCMKRLLAAGYPRLFQICRCWREGERGSWHLPEYTMLEWYRADCNYQVLMADCEELLARLCPEGQLGNVALTPPWERLPVTEAFARYGSIPLDAALTTDRFDEIIALEIEPQLGRNRPTFLTEYPAAMAALARRKPDNPRVAERFELYIDGLELANAFSELNDPIEQRQRFEKEEAERCRADKPSYPVPEKFLTELAAMPPSAGIALGIDRLVMLLTGATTIDEVVAFTPEEL
jgi:elongation factor P--(R)-beta-lysine ligase